MNSKKTLILVAALVIGAISAGMIWQYVGSIEAKANGDAARVKVYVVKTQIEKGTYGEEAKSSKTIEQSEIPKKFYPENAIRELTDIEGKQAINTLAPNQIVTTDMFADPAQVQSSFADRLDKINDEQQVAITVSIDEIRAVAGLLQPGDYVNIMMDNICTLGIPFIPPMTEDEPCPEEILFLNQARYLYQKVQILAIGKTPVPQAGEIQAAEEKKDGEEPDPEVAAGASMITFILPAEGAQYVASVAERLYLTLVGDDYEPIEGLDDIGITETIPAEDPTKLTPYGPKGPGDK